MPELTLKTLGNVLESQGIRPDAYCLTGGSPNESYCIDRDGDDWLVYYSERGLRSDLRRFGTESDACSHLQALLRGDATTQADP